ncbi:MAG: PLP-dependent aspartate aminotransferase family protein [Bacteroidota bacterium]|nr:PLP-dependent aspartate aminotransferase family protein [Bacteroidota bacterium]
MGNSSNKGFSTRAIHAGGHPDKETGAVMPPIYQTSTYVQSSPGEHKGYEYTRSHNPTRSRLEENLASLEQTTYALTSASGLSMIDLIMHMLPAGSKIISGDDVYGGTYRLFTTVFQDRHDFTFIDTTDLRAVKQALQEGADLIWLESPTNPTLKISDIASIASLAKETNTFSVVDNTFMSPYFQNPVVLGADIAYHSLTKFINGHSDVVGGAIMTNSETIYNQLFTLQNSIGPCASPFDSWLVLRGIKTLGVRMQRHAENAQQVAEFLEKHPRVQKVVYPGLESHPQHELAATQMSGFGGMITFYLDGDIEAARIVLERVKLFALAESLGGVESLIEHPAIMTHASVPKEVRESIGLYDNLIRLSVGIEDVEDLIDDLRSALQ